MLDGGKMNTNIGRKSLVIGIIFLFVGVSIAPSISLSVVIASQDDDLVEVSTQACGIKGFGNTTVKLTREQYNNLEQYLVSFRAQLNTTTTREDAVPIFKEAVVELNKYGLLPKGMSMEKAQRLVIGLYQNNNMLKLQEKLLYNSISGVDTNSNYLCLIAGNASEVMSYGFPVRSLMYLHISIEKLVALLRLPTLVDFLIFLDSKIKDFLLSAFWCNLFWQFFYTLIPLKIFSCLSFGIINDIPHFIPSNGWLFSIGLAGVKFWNNSFIGNISTMLFHSILDGGITCFIGIIGFTGIVINNSYSVNNYLIGSAFHVALSPAS
jgi:hypothetical protein